VAILDSTVYIDAGELIQLANEKKIEHIELLNYPKMNITRAKVKLKNGDNLFGVKLSKRKISDKTKEKVFKSVDGVNRWAYSLILKSSGDGAPAFCTMRIIITDSITIDEIEYNKENPFIWEKHHKK
jgi:hypothetical protein